MLVLGIEGTAHSAGVGIVDDTGKVLANIWDMYRPEQGGIHPREAADHHVQVLPGLIDSALEDAAVAAGDIEAVAFSQGPGLGPCLRTAATAARAFALASEVPLVGVNHCVAHLEVGLLAGARDPILLYTSGGNTQVIAYVDGRYRVMGETIDIGVGNFLDKLGRDVGLPFPAGPVIEKMAAEGTKLLPLPYSVKGMDVAFSGMLTAAKSLKGKGVGMPDVCRSVQETAFAMLCEVAERAMAHTGKCELLLGGGVARNMRLQEMARVMCHERGARMYVPPGDLCVDNGAMIAWLGLLMLRAGVTVKVEDSVINQRFRTDEVDAVWRDTDFYRALMEEGRTLMAEAHQGGGEGAGASAGGASPADSSSPPPTTDSTSHVENLFGSPSTTGEHIRTGAEAVLTAGEWFGRAAVFKRRVVKGYRDPELDAQLRTSRTRNEARLLAGAKELGVSAPAILDLDMEGNTLVLEDAGRLTLKDALLGAHSLTEDELKDILRDTGRSIALLHRGDIIHGDLTTSNIILVPKDGGGHTPCFIDPSLGEAGGTGGVEAMGVDMRCFLEAFRSTHPDRMELFEKVWEGYDSVAGCAREVRGKLADIEGRGRYR